MLDLDKSATLLDPQTGETLYWTRDCGIDGHNPVDLDEVIDERDLLIIRALPTWVWYEDMATFASRISDEQAARRLERAIRGRGAFRRFKDELNEEYPHLLPFWYDFKDNRANRRAVEWLAQESLIDEDVAEKYLDSHPDPDLP
jgi:hypothetical protein